MLEANSEAPMMNQPTLRPARKYPAEVRPVTSTRAAQNATPKTTIK
jgi:hypothetical protein